MRSIIPFRKSDIRTLSLEEIIEELESYGCPNFYRHMHNKTWSTNVELFTSNSEVTAEIKGVRNHPTLKSAAIELLEKCRRMKG